MLFSLVKGELQHSVACRKAQNKLRNISTTVQGLLHNYQLFNPFPCSCSRDSIRPGREYFRTNPLTNGRRKAKFPTSDINPQGTSLGTSRWGAAQTSPCLVGLQSRPQLTGLHRHQQCASPVCAMGEPHPLWEAQAQSPAKHLQTGFQSETPQSSFPRATGHTFLEHQFDSRLWWK